MELNQDVQADISPNSVGQKFLLRKVKGIGSLTYKETETQLEITEESIVALQVKKQWYKEKSRENYAISKREFQQIQVKTTWDKVDIFYAVFFAVIAYFTQWWILAGTLLCVWRAHGKFIEITKVGGEILQLPSGSGAAIDEVVNYICSHWARNPNAN